MIAALKFEWALNNPHKSLHIPADKRAEAVKGLGRRKTGHLKRPRKSLAGVMEALRMLVGVRSFGRWPLKVHFFEEEVWKVWEKGGKKSVGGGSEGGLKIEVVTDFGGPTASQEAGVGKTRGKGEKSAEIVNMADGNNDGDNDNEHAQGEKHGIYALPLDYTPLEEYIAKGQEIFEFERQGSCVVCDGAMVAGRGLYAICPNTRCEAVGHLDCWSRCLLKQEAKRARMGEGDEILPVKGACPKCHGEVLWGTMMKELTLRIRGQAEVDKLLKRKRRRAAKGKVKGKRKAPDEKGDNKKKRNVKRDGEVKTTSQRIVEDSEDSEFLDIAYL